SEAGRSSACRRPGRSARRRASACPPPAGLAMRNAPQEGRTSVGSEHNGDVSPWVQPIQGVRANVNSPARPGRIHAQSRDLPQRHSPHMTTEGGTPVGRGRAKAKQIKVARKLKYYSPDTDLDQLQQELGSDSRKSDSSDPYDDDPDYSAYADKYNVDDDDEYEDEHDED